MSNDEQERLKRLRERQLADRDPHTKQRQQQQFHAGREKKLAREKTSFKQIWRETSHVFRNITYSLLIGLVAVFIIPAIWDSRWTMFCIGGVTLVLIVFSVAIGQAMDTRDNIKDLMR